MNEYRKSGIIVGILYIIGTISGILSAVLTGTIDNPNEYFIKIASTHNIYTLGMIFVLIMGFSLAFIPIVLYPILKRQNNVMALGYVIFRGAIETITYIGIFICMSAILNIGKIISMNNDIQQFTNIGAFPKTLRLR
jgi:hypothetical protein